MNRPYIGAFLPAGVIDELSLVVAPIVAEAEGKPLFMDAGIENYHLTRTSASTVSSG